MAELALALKRTVFLPKGSPGICTVRQIKADIRRYKISADEGRIHCSGEADLLIEYLSFAEGRQYPGYEGYEQTLPDGGSMWQALLTLPFELTEPGDLPCPPLAELTLGQVDWFMVAPHALEMEMAFLLCWREGEAPCPEEAEQAYAKPQPLAAVKATPPATQPARGWQQISLNNSTPPPAVATPAASLLSQAIAEIQQNQAKTDKTNIKVILGGTLLEQKKDEKIINIGVSDQGWRLTDIEEIPQPPEAVIVDEVAITEELTAEEQEVSVVAETGCEETVVEKIVITPEAAIEQEEELLLAEELAGLRERERGEAERAAGLREIELGEAERAAGLRERERGEAERAAGLREIELGEAERAAGLREIELGEAERAAGLRERERGEAERAAGLRERERGEAERAAGLREQELGEAERAAGLREQELGEAERAAGLRERERGEAERAARPLVVLQTQETPYQPPVDIAAEMLTDLVAEAAKAAPAPAEVRRRVAGMPRLCSQPTRVEQRVTIEGYQVSYCREHEEDNLNTKK